jgi:hypothetical protein
MQPPNNPTPQDEVDIHLNDVDIHYLVEDKLSALPAYLRQGYSIAIEPFPTDDGKCAVLQDAHGTRLGILERAIETDQTIRH